MAEHAPHDSTQVPQAEPLFVMRRGTQQLSCQLRYHGEWGYEVQFHVDGHLLMSCGFDNRDDVISWADRQRLAQTAQGWTDEPTAEWSTRGRTVAQ